MINDDITVAALNALQRQPGLHVSVSSDMSIEQLLFCWPVVVALALWANRNTKQGDTLLLSFVVIQMVSEM